jgi:carbonic anhydrase
MATLQRLLENNRRWAASMKQSSPDFFSKLVAQQSPKYLWIGCADSRVPANQIVGLMPGDLFVHRNVANLVLPADLNCLSVLQYAVEDLQVEHVIVCGHYGCGGVKAAIGRKPLGLIDNWIRVIKDIYQLHLAELDGIDSLERRADRLCELNVIHQSASVAHTTIVQDAWRRGQTLTVHGWIYSIGDGLLRDLNVSFDGLSQVPERYRLDG